MSAAPAPTDGVPVDQPSAAPTAKWIAGVGTGSAALLVVWVAGLFKVELSPEEAGGLVLAAGAAAAWVKRNHATVAGVLERDRGLHLDRNGDGLADR